MDRPLSLSAHAKINLYLHVTGRRADGYHLLDSLVVFADLADELEFSLDDRLSLSVDWRVAREAGMVEDNLVLRAARSLRESSAISTGARIRLTKRIPVAAGLGGGSADAAATLLALARLWRIDRRRIDLNRIALRLGTDVPVCLAGEPAFVSGIGEILAAPPILPEAGLLLVNPGIRLSTPAVFGARPPGFSAPGRFGTAPATARELAALLAGRTNDLSAAAISLAPPIRDVIAALEELRGCRLARMSGSGPTCFGLFDDVTSAAAAGQKLSRKSDWWVRASRIRPASRC